MRNLTLNNQIEKLISMTKGIRIISILELILLVGSASMFVSMKNRLMIAYEIEQVFLSVSFLLLGLYLVFRHSHGLSPISGELK